MGALRFKLLRCQILSHRAVVGLKDQAGARRLVRTLLADPLAAEQPWEKELLSKDGEDGKAILFR